MITVVILIIASYLIGSISFAMLIAQAHGIDLRAVGSGNLGATNLSRACGKKWAYICFALDLLKGFIPVFAAKIIIIPKSPTPGILSVWLLIGAAAIIGHIFPCFFNFKGGKGVATSFGFVLGIWPYYTIAGIAAFIIWALVVLTSKYISLGSVLAAAAFPMILIILTAFVPGWHFNILWPLILTAIILCSLVIFLHRSNLKRIVEGNEHKVMQSND